MEPESGQRPRKTPAEALAMALQGAWDDWCDDTGCIPDEFEIHGPSTTRVTADFEVGPFVENTVRWLTEAGYEVVDRG